MIVLKPPFIVIETNKTSLVWEIKGYDDEATSFNKNKQYLTQRYYGPKVDLGIFSPSAPQLNKTGSNVDYNIDFLITSTFGDGNTSEPSLLIDNADSTNINRFFFKEAKIIKGGINNNLPHAREVKETLDIVEVDEVMNIELHHYYSIFADSEVIVAKNEIINKGNKPLTLRKLVSLQLPIPTKQLKIYTFDGHWGFERSRHETIHSSGMYLIDSKIGSSSHKHNPFVEFYDDNNDLWFGMNLIYSGNHKETFEIDNLLTHAYVTTGINDFSFAHKINPNKSFITPEAVLVCSKSLDDITLMMQDFALNHVANPKFAHKERPIIFNNWEGTLFNIDEQSLYEMAVIAKRVGVEQFVMDDGWFKNRIDDHRALGDWVTDKNKFPNGLGSLSEKIKSLGLKFGIWVEPEMICLDSDIYRAHPEYASIIPNREPLERRQQLMIDMTNPDVVDYVFNSLCKVFDECKPDYVKWDYNRYMSDNFSIYNYNSGEYMHKFILGTYALMDRLTTRYPNILFEGCSSGGGRFDLGILYYMPQSWASDDTNTFLRTFITAGTLVGYPQSSFGAHVSQDISPLIYLGIQKFNQGRSSLEDRFNLNCVGAFGYEFDFRHFSEEELTIMAKQVEWYKKHRSLLQFGKYYINKNCYDNPMYYSHTLVNEDQSEAIILALETNLMVPPTKWTVKGLNPSFSYKVTAREQYNVQNTFNGVFTGQFLMEEGLDLGKLSETSDKESFVDGVYSRILYIEKI